MVESLLLTTARVVTFQGGRSLTNASGFFFERSGKLFLVTSRHVLVDEPSEHFPDRLEVDLHVDVDNLTVATNFSIALYHAGKQAWREGRDAAGEVDVAVVEIDRSALPWGAVLRAFGQSNLPIALKFIADALAMLDSWPLKECRVQHKLPSNN